MKTFPADLKFKYTWRPYQERILDELESHLTDNRLHIVAAPGSGKTVLGLEVIRRINQPSLILAPTLAIRDQWVERLETLFLSSREEKCPWISKDIKNPKFFTVSTYQGLYSVYSGKIQEYEEDGKNGEDDEEIEKKNEEKQAKNTSSLSVYSSKKKINIVSLLKKVGVKTIVVDEAHHLRINWWKSLSGMIKQLGNIKIVALTATPPYDVVISEWNRYIQLCGPVDAEISVPELVKEKNLCPHQDYILFSTPSRDEITKIRQIRKDISLFAHSLNSNQKFIDYLLNHHWFKFPESNIDEILDEPAFFSSILIFLNHQGIRIPKKLTNIVTDSSYSLPKLDYEWLEILMTGLLYSSSRENTKGLIFLEELKNNLKRIGSLERREINLRSVKVINKTLRRSVSKLRSIKEIVKLEYNSLGRNLRMVILTDFIRKDFLSKTSDDEPALKKLGVVPIFESIRREKLKDVKLGILCGSLVIVPKISVNLLKNVITKNRIDLNKIKLTELPNDKNFFILVISGVAKQSIVQIMTEVFSKGGINVLVGTKSLLGEGWDAPSINSLVLASFVGSFMLSNQMRGRAMRIEKNNPKKTANIWHLVCIEKGELCREREELEQPQQVGHDFEIMLRRFKTFVGVSFEKPLIENGLERLNISNPPFNKKSIETVNEEMCKKAVNRAQMKEDWEVALKQDEMGINLVHIIRAKEGNLPREFVFKNTIAALIFEALCFAWFILTYTFKAMEIPLRLKLPWSIALDIMFYTLIIGLSLVILISFPKLLRALLLFLKHGSIASSLRQVGIVVLKSLSYNGIITTELTKLKVISRRDRIGRVICFLEGGTNREKSLYLDVLRELLNPIENPRYILMRKSLLSRILRRVDYLAVPSVIGVKREYSDYFAKQWEGHVGKMELIYTRNKNGRRTLIKARNYSLSAGFRPRSERISQWM